MNMPMKPSIFIGNPAIYILLLFQHLIRMQFELLLLIVLLRHLFYQSIELISQNLHRSLCFLSDFFGVFQLILQQLFQFFVFLLNFFIFNCFFHERVDAAGLDGWLSLIPVIIDQRVFQDTNFGSLLLVLLEYFLQLGITQLQIPLILTIIVQLDCKEVFVNFMQLILLCVDVHDSLNF